MSQTIPYSELHAFSDGDQPFTGNPAGVAHFDAFPPDNILLGIAQSNNLSETAFLVPKAEDLWDLRWLTPAREVDLCGHATLAAGADLFARKRVVGDVARFDSRSGRLEVREVGDGVYAMDLPAVPGRVGTARPEVNDAIGAGSPEAIFDIDPIHGSDYQMLVYHDEAAVRAINPEFARLAAMDINIIVTAPGKGVDFVSRFFCPAAGITEDPVTGSAHCTLAPYWSERLGRARLSARQIGPRPGALEVEPKEKRVTLLGRATRFLIGEISF